MINKELSVDEGDGNPWKEKAAVYIGGNMMGKSIEGLTKEFDFVPNKLKHPGKHLSISLPVGEEVPDFAWRIIAEKTVKDAGYTDNQWVCYRHVDTDHEHVHIIINRKDSNGKTVKDSNEKYKLMDIMRKRELEHNLSVGKNFGDKNTVKETTYEQLLSRQGQGTDKSRLVDIVKFSLDKANNWDDFIKGMKAFDVEWVPRINDREQMTGARFHFKDKTYSGSKIGHSLNVIKNHLNEKEYLREQVAEHFLKKRNVRTTTAHEFIDKMYKNGHHEGLIRWINSKSEKSQDDQDKINDAARYITKKGYSFNDKVDGDVFKAMQDYTKGRRKYKKAVERTNEALRITATVIFESREVRGQRGYMLDKVTQIKQQNKKVLEVFCRFCIGLDRKGNTTDFITGKQSKENASLLKLALTPEEYTKMVEPLVEQRKDNLFKDKPRELFKTTSKIVGLFLEGLARTENGWSPGNLDNLLGGFTNESLKGIDLKNFTEQQQKDITESIDYIQSPPSIEDDLEQKQQQHIKKGGGMSF